MDREIVSDLEEILDNSTKIRERALNYILSPGSTDGMSRLQDLNDLAYIMNYNITTIRDLIDDLEKTI